MKTLASVRMKSVLAVTAALSVVVVLVAGVVRALVTSSEGRNIEVASSLNLGEAFGAWSMPATTGAVDESDLDIFKSNNGGKVTVRSSGGTLNMRYPVTANENLKNVIQDGVFIMFRFRDNGDNARVVCRLKVMDNSNGVVTTRLMIDSNDFPPSDSYQTRFLTVVDNENFNFDFKTYWVEVSITRTSSRGKPGLALVSVGKVDI